MSQQWKEWYGRQVAASTMRVEQVSLSEAGVGVVVLAYRTTAFHGEPELLLRARVGPGNEKPGKVLLGPTLQASESNLQQAHGGKAPPRAELFPQVIDRSWWVELPMDGGRFLGKSNRGALLEVQNLTPDGDEFWFSRCDLKDAVTLGLLNEHLLQLLGIALIQGVFNPHGI